jgi:hypothetical protein
MAKQLKTDVEIVKEQYPQAELQGNGVEVWIVSEPAAGPRVSAQYRVVDAAKAWASAAHWITEEIARKKRHAEVMRADKAISHKVVRALLAAGFSITIDNGGCEDGEFEIVKSTDARAIFKALHLTDEDYIKPFRDGKYHGWVRLIYGESGWDVICDNTTNLEEYVGDGTEVRKVIDYWENRICG